MLDRRAVVRKNVGRIVGAGAVHDDILEIDAEACEWRTLSEDRIDCCGEEAATIKTRSDDRDSHARGGMGAIEEGRLLGRSTIGREI